MKTYIHMRKGWPEFRWDEAALAPLLASTRHAQGRLLGRMEGLGFRLRGEADLAILTSEIVKSSAIEGEMLDDREVRSSLARRLGIDVGGTAPVSRAVEGVVEMMVDATRNYEAPLDEERLFGWHAALFPTGRSGMRKITVGGWRAAEAGPMQVVSGALGRERVHFEAPTADRLPDEMHEFLEWFNAEQRIDPVLKAAVSHFWFVTIHPFEDGNGRIARAVADMALARADGTTERFYSMSTRIDAERKDYYRVLERTQRSDLDVTPWLTWFLGCLERAIDQAHGLTAQVLRKAVVWRSLDGGPPINERQRLVVNRLLDGFEGGLTSSKYAKLAKCSSDTALRDIHDLVARGVLMRTAAGGRSTSYRLVD